VEIIAERIVATRIEVQRAHDGGDTELLGAHREAGHGGGEPQDFLPRVKEKEDGGAVTPLGHLAVSRERTFDVRD
jgi:hypothetical protein